VANQWLEGYSGHTTDQLIGLASHFRTDSIVLAFEQGITAKIERLGQERLSSAERVVLAVEALEREVNSEGYAGLFATQQVHVPNLVGALTAIGADTAADLTRSAINVLGIDGSLTAAAVAAAVAQHDAERDRALNGLDVSYYASAGDLAPRLLEYIKANRAQIVLP